MSLFKLNDIALKGKGNLIGAHSNLKVSRLSIDSRTTLNRDLFIALKGPFFDGHDFLEEAKKKGAASFVVERPVDLFQPYILVKDTHKFLEDLGKERRKDFNGKVIGVTGSNGKTSTKEIISSILSKKGRCHKTEGNKNNQIGVPLSLSSLNNDFNFSVIEIGTNSPGEIDSLSKLVKPDIALITNAAESHLEGLGSLKSVVKEKGSILDNLKDNGVAILPRDSRFYKEWKERAGNKKIVTFGSNKKSNVILEKVEVNIFENITSFRIKCLDLILDCEVRGIGNANSLNSSSAFAVAHALNLDLKEISSNLKNVVFPERRLSVHKGFKNCLVIDDTYNSNPDSMKISLDVVRDLKQRKRIFIAGEMAELGENKQLFHNQISEYAKDCVDEFLCIGKLWEEGIKNLSGIGKLFASKEDILDYLFKTAQRESIIIVKGSRSTNMDFISDKLKRKDVSRVF